jgi:hypothetical protein
MDSGKSPSSAFTNVPKRHSVPRHGPAPDPNPSIRSAFYHILSTWKVRFGQLVNVSSAEGSYAAVRFGSLGDVLSGLGFLDTEEVRKTHWNINRWKDDEVLAWKNSYVSSCAAIAVAGAIFASVGLGSLSLPNLEITHWSARALLSCSMALGILSVVYATTQQQTVAMLNSPLEIRLWLSRGRVDRLQHDYQMPYRLLPLESSVATVKQFGLPSLLLKVAVLLYLVGFGIYILFAWLNNVEKKGTDSRNVFICFVITLGVISINQILLTVYRFIDEQKRIKDFSLDRAEDFAKPYSQQQLEAWLKAIQELQERNVQDTGHDDKLESKVANVLREWMAQTQAELEEKELAANKEKREKWLRNAGENC